jgi:hypothetical protein
MKPVFIPFFLFATGLFAADAVNCPPKIETMQRLMVPAPGWSVSSDKAPHQLAGLTFFEGKPEEKASFVPDKQEKVNGKTLASWTFVAGERGIWATCTYSGTDIVLARQLPKNTRACSVTYSTTETISGLPVIEKVDCK